MSRWEGLVAHGEIVCPESTHLDPIFEYRAARWDCVHWKYPFKPIFVYERNIDQRMNYEYREKFCILIDPHPDV